MEPADGTLKVNNTVRARPKNNLFFRCTVVWLGQEIMPLSLYITPCLSKHAIKFLSPDKEK